jgi:hypothetical protein
MVYGGVITTDANVGYFEDKINGWREEKNMKGELKWTKVSPKKLAQYESLVDLFFEYAKKNVIHFKAVVFDTHQIKDKQFHQGDANLRFHKFYYQFLLHKFGHYAKTDDHLLWVFLDQRSESDTVKLGTLRKVLASGIKNKYGRKTDVVRRVEARDSHECNLMQVADVLMGAVGFHCNDWHQAMGASAAKCSLAAKIAKLAGLKTLATQTYYGKVDFEIWRFQFKAKK